MATSEHSEQRELVLRMRRAGVALAAIPNGAHLRGGAREAAKLKAEGMEPGVPDLLVFDLPTELGPASAFERELVEALRGLSAEGRARVLALAGCGPGSAIEMKRADGGQLSTEQARWGGMLRARGWRWGVAHGWRQGLDQLRAWGYRLP